MKSNIRKAFESLKVLFDNVSTTDERGLFVSLDEAYEHSIKIIREINTGKLLFIGNGASASIASHMAIDFSKRAGIRAMAFNDGALLTCISNDYGYEHVFAKPIQIFADAGDVLISISSSGQSVNILCAVSEARKKGLKVISLSGFEEDNPLRKSGDINFYVPSSSYGHVEVLHHAICHCMLDLIVNDDNLLIESDNIQPYQISTFGPVIDKINSHKNAELPKR